MSVTRRLLPFAFLATLVPAAARAQQPAQRDPIAAETLFDRGKELMDHGEIDAACAAFAESQRLDPAGGTLLRLALCHEQQKKLASAWYEFQEVERVSRETSAGDPAKLAERIRLAREHRALVEKRLPRLTIDVPPASRVAGLTVTANGSARNEGSWGIPIPTDPGDVEIVATAPSRKEFRATQHIDEGAQLSVEIPQLPLENAPAATPTPTTSATPPGIDQRPETTRGSSTRTIGIVVGAVGIVGIGVGSFFGLRAISKWNDSNSACPGTSCDPTSVSLANDARSAAHVADVAIGLGVAAVAVGVVLYVVGAPETVQPRASGLAVAF